MRIHSAIIGGTGLGRHIEMLPGKSMFVPTPHGLVKGKLVTVESTHIYCVRRHSAGHSVPPHKVNYIAIAFALRSLGVRACFASAAVGSLHPTWKVGDFVECNDFLDLSSRNITAFEDKVEHRDFSAPFSKFLKKLVGDVAINSGIEIKGPGIYANLNGPRYETPHEIAAVGILGGNLVGMTAASEAIAMNEFNIPYSCISVVTNAAAGMEEAPLSHLDVVSVMEERGKLLLDLFLTSATRLSQS